MENGKTLSQFVKDNSKFLKLADGESFEGFYRGFKVSSSSYDPEKEIVVYKLAYSDGKEVFFQTASVAVARTLIEFKGNERIKITRQGTGQKTKYEITSQDIQVSEDEMAPDQEVQF